MINMKLKSGSDLQMFQAVAGKMPEIGDTPLPPSRAEQIKRWCASCCPQIAEQAKKRMDRVTTCFPIAFDCCRAPDTRESEEVMDGFLQILVDVGIFYMGLLIGAGVAIHWMLKHDTQHAAVPAAA